MSNLMLTINNDKNEYRRVKLNYTTPKMCNWYFVYLVSGYISARKAYDDILG